MKGGIGKFLNNGETGGDGEVVGRRGLNPCNCVIFGDGMVPSGKFGGGKFGGMKRELDGDGLSGFNDGELDVEPPTLGK